MRDDSGECETLQSLDNQGRDEVKDSFKAFGWAGKSLRRKNIGSSEKFVLRVV
jgi:hypothetical protein